MVKLKVTIFKSRKNPLEITRKTKHCLNKKIEHTEKSTAEKKINVGIFSHWKKKHAKSRTPFHALTNFCNNTRAPKDKTRKMVKWKKLCERVGRCSFCHVNKNIHFLLLSLVLELDAAKGKALLSLG